VDTALTPINVMELEQLAAQRLPAQAFDYYRSGAGDEHTLRRNVEALREIALHYRVLVDVSERDLSSELLGTATSMPVLLAPTAFHKLAHPEGEVASARAAHAADTIMVLSTLSTSPVEEVAATHAKLWFQLYVYKDRGATRELIARVEQAGVRALVLTVDAPLLGRREADVRNRFALPPGLRIENLRAQDHARVDAHASDSGLADYFQRVLDPSLGYRDLEWLCATARVPVLVKGVVRGDDARRAIAHGARGVIVSNHGGRQLDGAPAIHDRLPALRLPAALPARWNSACW
jgi:4-hydroxymandelate oxidase